MVDTVGRRFRGEASARLLAAVFSVNKMLRARSKVCEPGAERSPLRPEHKIEKRLWESAEIRAEWELIDEGNIVDDSNLRQSAFVVSCCLGPRGAVPSVAE